MLEVHLFGDVLEFQSTEIFVENTRLLTVGRGEFHRSACHTNVIAASPFFVGRVNPDVGHKHVEQSIVVEIEERRSRRMANVIQARLLGDIAEFPATQVFKEHVTHLHGRHEQVGIAIVIQIGKRRGDTNFVVQSHSCGRRDVLKLSVAEISPKLAAANLVDEVKIDLAVAIDICRGQTRAVIVNDRLQVPPAIIHDMMLEGDSTTLNFIGELETVKGFEFPG